MKEKSIYELLIILRDNANVVKTWLGLRQRIKAGLCREIMVLSITCIFTMEEFDIIMKYIRNEVHKIGGDYYDGYLCEATLWKPRLKWLNKHIELNR